MPREIQNALIDLATINDIGELSMRPINTRGRFAPILRPMDGWPTQARFWLEWGATLLARALYDLNIRNYPQLVEKLRYIHRNPDRAELCLRSEDRVEQFSPLRNCLR